MRLYNGNKLKDYAFESIPDSSILAGQKEIATIAQATSENLFNAFIQSHQLVVNNLQPSPTSKLALLNGVGEILYEQPITQSPTEINLSHYPAGIYLVLYEDGEKREVKKVVID